MLLTVWYIIQFILMLILFGAGLGLLIGSIVLFFEFMTDCWPTTILGLIGLFMIPCVTFAAGVSFMALAVYWSEYIPI